MFLWSSNVFNNSSFNTFPGISQNLPENVSIFFAKMIDLCLLTQKNQTLWGVIGRNIALWQNLWVGVGRFERRSSSALCGWFNQIRSPYSWITMRRALRKGRVFDFVPSYLIRSLLSRTWATSHWQQETVSAFAGLQSAMEALPQAHELAHRRNIIAYLNSVHLWAQQCAQKRLQNVFCMQLEYQVQTCVCRNVRKTFCSHPQV